MAIALPPEHIEVDRRKYLRLLIKTNNLDPAEWPAGFERGAELLREIRAIEQGCVAEHGRWHPDLLPEGGEDHYEDLIYELDRLIEPYDPNGPKYTHDEILADLFADEAEGNGHLE